MAGWNSVAALMPTATRPDPARRDLAQVVDAYISAQQTGVNAGNAMGIPAVFACVRLLASTINQLPVTMTRGDVPEWLRRPRRWGSTLDSYDLLQHVVTAMALRGHAYLHVTRFGESWRLDAVHPDAVGVTARTDGIVGLAYTLAGEQIERCPDSPLDAVQRRPYLLPIPYLITPEHPEGAGPVQLAQAAFRGYLDTESYTGNLFASGTWNGGVLSTDADITADTAKRYQTAWVTNRLEGKIPVLGAGLQYENTILSPADAQWIEARGFNAAQIAMMFGIPPDFLGMSMVGSASSLSYNNAQDNNRRYRVNAVAAFTQQIEDALSTLLKPGRNGDEAVRVTFDYSMFEGGSGAAPADQPMADPDRG